MTDIQKKIMALPKHLRKKAEKEQKEINKKWEACVYHFSDTMAGPTGPQIDWDKVDDETFKKILARLNASWEAWAKEWNSKLVREDQRPGKKNRILKVSPSKFRNEYINAPGNTVGSGPGMISDSEIPFLAAITNLGMMMAGQLSPELLKQGLPFKVYQWEDHCRSLTWIPYGL